MSWEDREAGRLDGLREALAYVQAVHSQAVDESPQGNGQRRMAARIISGLEILIGSENLSGVRKDRAGRTGG